MMFRLDVTDPKSLETIQACSRGVSQLNKYSIPVFLEAFSVERTTEGYKTLRTAEELIKTINVATALGDSSRGIWLKVPYCSEFERVVRSTSFPILILGGEALGDPAGVLSEFSKGMRAGQNVRGALVGRNVLYPASDDPLAIADAVSGIVHRNFTVEEALSHIETVRGRNMDKLTSVLA